MRRKIYGFEIQILYDFVPVVAAFLLLPRYSEW